MNQEILRFNYLFYYYCCFILLILFLFIYLNRFSVKTSEVTVLTLRSLTTFGILPPQLRVGSV